MSSHGSPAVPDWVDRDAYPFRSHWVELPAGGRMHYVDEGSGDVLLFVHGTPTWSFEWRHLIRELSRRYRCIAPDHLGFGLSDRPRDADYSPEAHAARLAAFVERLGLERFTLVVHDFGGPIALPLALDESRRVKALVVLNSWMWSFAGDAEMERAARIAGGPVGRILYEWANLSLKAIMPGAYADRKRLTRAIHRQYLMPFPDRWSRGAVLWALARSLLGSSAHYDALWQRRGRLRDVPALVIWGTKDGAFKPRLLERWREALPHAEVHQLPVGHWPHEEDPMAVLQRLGPWLAARVPAGRTAPAAGGA